jgi:hypothetical protein
MLYISTSRVIYFFHSYLLGMYTFLRLFNLEMPGHPLQLFHLSYTFFFKHLFFPLFIIFIIFLLFIFFLILVISLFIYFPLKFFFFLLEPIAVILMKHGLIQLFIIIIDLKYHSFFVFYFFFNFR